jgi:hypothetical protein
MKEGEERREVEIKGSRWLEEKKSGESRRKKAVGYGEI